MSRVSLPLLLLCATGAAAAAPIAFLRDARARCLDGSRGAYYVEPASAPVNATKFILYLEGGGECASAASCLAATRGVLGSSTFDTPTRTFDEGLFFASGEASNPFSGYTRVYLPYCSQDLHSGTRTTNSSDTFGLYFSGHLIFASLLDDLTAWHGLAAATEFILTGGSAGGIGVWINANYLASRLPVDCRVTLVSHDGLGLRERGAICTSACASPTIAPPPFPAAAYVPQRALPCHPCTRARRARRSS